jgi:uncharacterized membrane protein YhhN
MKNTDMKFVAGLALMTTGLILISIGNRWPFFIGLAMFMISGLFSLRRDTRPESRFVRLVRMLGFIGIVIFLVWLSSFGVEKPPLTPQIGIWLAISYEEFHAWRKSRRLT